MRAATSVAGGTLATPKGARGDEELADAAGALRALGGEALPAL